MKTPQRLLSAFWFPIPGKPTSWPFLCCSVICFLLSAFPVAAAQGLPAPTAYAVADRGAHSKVWERTVYEATPQGPVPKKHRYQELATGMHFKRNGEGPWLETIERFELLPNGQGAAATNGPHQLFVPPIFLPPPLSRR
jgi:hypothetical protein